MRPLVRLPLRRYVTSLPPPSPPRRRRDGIIITIGASLAVACYVSWRIAGNSQRIVKDAPSQRVFPKADDTSDTSQKTDVSAPSHRQIQAGRERVDAPVEEEGQTVPEEAEGEGAFNPVTGEINWDCPCLGGMAHGPCGQQFREAFSCFVFSEEEPKGINCVDKFKNMQDCFRAHPDLYGEEIADDDDAPELRPGAEDKSSQSESPTETSVINPTPLSEDVSNMSSKSAP